MHEEHDEYKKFWKKDVSGIDYTKVSDAQFRLPSVNP